MSNQFLLLYQFTSIDLQDLIEVLGEYCIEVSVLFLLNTPYTSRPFELLDRSVEHSWIPETDVLIKWTSNQRIRNERDTHVVGPTLIKFILLIFVDYFIGHPMIIFYQCLVIRACVEYVPTFYVSTPHRELMSIKKYNFKFISIITIINTVIVRHMRQTLRFHYLFQHRPTTSCF